MSIEDKYDPEKEIEKLCEENKIYFTMNNKGRYVEVDAVKAAGLLNLAHSQLLKFIEEKRPNGFYPLLIKNPETKIEYPLQIKYEGAEEPEPVEDTMPRWKCLSCGTYARQEERPRRCSCGGRKFWKEA